MTALLRGLLTFGLWWLLALGSPVQAQPVQPVPPLTDRVIDQTGTLQPAQHEALVAQLAALEREVGSQFVVLLVRSTQPEDIAAYAQRVGDQWKLGRRTVGDGLLIVVATQDRKVRIEVAKTLEGAIPDLMAKRVINEQITPAFRQGDVAGGLSAAVRVLGGLAKGEGLPAPAASERGGHGSGGGQDGPDPVMWVLLAVVMLPAFARAIVGVFGRKLGPLLTSGGAGGVAWLLTASAAAAGVAAAVGLVVALVVGVLGFLSPRVTRGRSFPTPGGWGGGGGGGWGGGGSSGGGGFSSGGGGDFGGGGASGSW